MRLPVGYNWLYNSWEEVICICSFRTILSPFKPKTGRIEYQNQIELEYGEYSRRKRQQIVGDYLPVY
jgi:hypothetical protein